jgi:hypothetical protein
MTDWWNFLGGAVAITTTTGVWNTKLDDIVIFLDKGRRAHATYKETSKHK